jgi:predicted ArsR family transcriptional regulator
MAKTNTPQIKIVNVETGEETLRDATTEEIAQMEADKAEAMATKAEVEAKTTARQAILDRLGLTAEEATLLLS